MDKANACSLLRGLVIVEIVIFLLGGIIVTNLHPQWMQVSVFVSGGTLLVTMFVWLIVCKR